MLGIVTVPYIESEAHKNLARASYASFKGDALRVAVINRCEDRSLIESYNQVVVNNTENCLARGWNIGVQLCIDRGCDRIYIPNLDVVISESGIERLMDFQDETKAGIVSMTAIGSVSQVLLGAFGSEPIEIQNHDQSFSSFMITVDAYKEIGEFDENLKPAYYEDCDYLYRAKLKGIKSLRDKGNIYYHYTQGTVKESTVLKEEYSEFMNNNKIYYIKKWGGEPNQEIFKKPFNK